MFARSREDDAMNLEQHLLVTGTGLWLQGPTSTASCADVGTSYRRECGRDGMDAVAVECVVVRRVLATLDGGRPMLRAALDASPARPWVQNYSPRIPHGKVTKWQSIRISPCQEAIIG